MCATALALLLTTSGLSACNIFDDAIDQAVSAINLTMDNVSAQSDAWRDQLDKLPHQLAGLESKASSDAKSILRDATSQAKRLAEETIELTDAKVSGIIAQAGVEFRCNADFIKSGVHDELQFLVDDLKFWQKHKKEGVSPPQHRLCWDNPSVLSLYRGGDRWRVDTSGMADKDVIHVYGYNFRSDALPRILLQDMNGGTIRDATVKPAYVTRYQIDLDISTETFQDVQTGSRLALAWPDQGEPTTISLTLHPAAHLTISNVSVTPTRPTAQRDPVTLHARITNTGGSPSDDYGVNWQPDPQETYVVPVRRPPLKPGESADLTTDAYTFQRGGTLTSVVSVDNGDDSQRLDVDVQPPIKPPPPPKVFLDTTHKETGNFVGGFGKDIDFGGSCDSGFTRSIETNVWAVDSSGGAAVWWHWTNDDPASCRVTVHYSISPRNWIEARIKIVETGA